MKKYIPLYEEFIKMIEDGTAVASASTGSGLGNVSSPQPSTNSGALNGSGWADGGGTTGSGDIASSLGTYTKKYHDPTFSNKKIKKKTIPKRKIKKDDTK